ncbi:hypothetical protein [Bacillus cereus]|uniref:hypothetical protein n=1 Tax=Bacillus cereus TaxID=1396 RepID=UPI0009959D91|nr:hypothetical protein [Bacillus cereus]
MDRKEHYESVISGLEEELLNIDKIREEKFQKMEIFLRETELSGSEVEFILSSMDYYYGLGKDYKFYESNIKKYKEKINELE